MASQERVSKSKSDKKKVDELEKVKVKDKATAEADALKDELDDLLDEIDSVLEVNAEEFIRGYIQKGGQLCKTFWENVKVGFNISRRNVVQWKYENMRSAQL